MKPEVCTVDFNLIVFYEKVKKYINGIILDDSLYDFSFGCNVYENLLDYYKQDLVEYDIRNVQKLLEHKKSLLRSFRFIKENNIVDDKILESSIIKIKELVEKCEKIKKLTIKYNIYPFNHNKKKKEYVENILIELSLIKGIEISCLKNIIKKLEKSIS